MGLKFGEFLTWIGCRKHGYPHDFLETSMTFGYSLVMSNVGIWMCDLMGIYGDLMGFHCDLMRIYGDLMGY